MILLPIVDRELRVAARRWATYWMRTGFALGTIVIGIFVYLANLDSSSRTFGSSLFAALAFIAMFYCLVAGVRSTADCLSEEKREGTLGLLFLTDLKGYDVVFGKLVASSIRSFYGLMAILPILAVPLLLGGLTNGEFWRAVLVLVNTFLFSLATGVFVSAASRSARKAMALTFGLLLLFTAVFPAGAGLIYWLTPSHKSLLADLMLWPCPIYSFAMSEDSGYRFAMWRYWGSVGVIQGLTWLYWVLASWLVPRTWQEKPAEGSALRWRQLWGRWLYGNGARRKLFRARLLDVNACYWLAGRDWFKPVQVWSFLVLVAGFWGWGCIAAGSEWFNEGVYFPTAILLNSGLKLWVASVAGRQLAEDRKTGALELVLSTPLSVKEILRGHWLALGRQFLGPLVMVIGIEGIFLAASLQRESWHDNPLNPTLWLTGIIMLVGDVLALAWCAMWAALTVKNPSRITGITVVRILVAPWIVFIGVAILADLMQDSGEPTWKFNVGWWFGLGLVTDLAFGLTAWWQVRTSFRRLALQRFAPVQSRFARWLRRR